jgi:hypothetical protein
VVRTKRRRFNRRFQFVRSFSLNAKFVFLETVDCELVANSSSDKNAKHKNSDKECSTRGGQRYSLKFGPRGRTARTVRPSQLGEKRDRIFYLVRVLKTGRSAQ